MARTDLGVERSKTIRTTLRMEGVAGGLAIRMPQSPPKSPAPNDYFFRGTRMHLYKVRTLWDVEEVVL